MNPIENLWCYLKSLIKWRTLTNIQDLIRPILHLFSQPLSTVFRCGGQLLNVTFSFLSAWYVYSWPAFVPIGVSCRCVIDVVWLSLVCSNSNHCLFNELPCASTTVRHTGAAAATHPLEFEVSRFRTAQLVRSFLPAQVRLWNDLPYTMFDTGTLDGFKGAVNRWLLP